MDDRDRTWCERALVDGDRALEYYRRIGEGWANDELAVDAIVKRVESFCEHVGNISDEEQALHPEFRWRQIHGTRNRLAHAYHHIDLAVIQEVLTDHLPRDLAAIRRWLSPP